MSVRYIQPVRQSEFILLIVSKKHYVYEIIVIIIISISYDIFDYSNYLITSFDYDVFNEKHPQYHSDIRINISEYMLRSVLRY